MRPDDAAELEAARLLWRYSSEEGRSEVPLIALDNGQARGDHDLARADAGGELLERARARYELSAELLVAYCALGDNAQASSLARALALMLER